MGTEQNAAARAPCTNPHTTLSRPPHRASQHYGHAIELAHLRTANMSKHAIGGFLRVLLPQPVGELDLQRLHLRVYVESAAAVEAIHAHTVARARL
jgi:hypothetical protein